MPSMEWGMQNRLARIIRPDTGRAVMLAVDHGYFLGPVSSLEDPGSTVKPLLPYTDTLMVTRGVLRNCVDPDSGVNVVLRVSGGQSIVGPAIEDETITTSMDDAIRNLRRSSRVYETSGSLLSLLQSDVLRQCHEI